MSGNRNAMVVRVAELEIFAEHLESYTTLLAEEIGASVEAESGVISLNAVATKDNPTNILILEVYASQEDYQAHLQTPHFLKYKTLTSHMVKSLRLSEVDPIKMRGRSFDVSFEQDGNT